MGKWNHQLRGCRKQALGTGQDKLREAAKSLKRYFPNKSDDEIRLLAESAVRRMKEREAELAAAQAKVEKIGQEKQ